MDEDDFGFGEDFDDLDDGDGGLDEVDFSALETDADEYGEGEEIEDDVDGWKDA